MACGLRSGTYLVVKVGGEDAMLDVWNESAAQMDSCIRRGEVSTLYYDEEVSPEKLEVGMVG